MGSKRMSSSQGKPKRAVVIPRPSSSVLLISPQNQVLLLHRVRTSSSFASAHVFPGGNLEAFHDGEIPAVEDPARHQDGEAYRLAAIRETFEESGILLAKNAGFGRLIEVPEKEREEGRRLVHSGEVKFGEWLARKGGRADIENLIPFTRWVTPTNIPKRFTTQMYIYFLPAASASSPSSDDTSGTDIGPLSTTREAVIPVPTSDGGIEHTAARFLPASTWLNLSRANKIILFPPQFFLLYLVSQFLSPPSSSSTHPPEVLQQQRKALQEFIKHGSPEGSPPWGEVCISPNVTMAKSKDGRGVLGLDKAGPELEGMGRKGVREWVVKVNFKKDVPRDVDVAKREEVFGEERGAKL